ncbi:hypothetical protein GDO81_007888 [Engystomops pustulosus]|uniref:CD109 antigen n=1 Tax=Engystomops pustulosus TaxID=76066 RepID=A0AAV7CBF0_ENGPU|nr:hypothetical protein GDO81_007888 [Engystomops pustulosus]
MYLLWASALRHGVILFFCLASCKGSPSYYITIPAKIIPGANTSLAVHWFGDKYSEITVNASIVNDGKIIANASKVFQNDSIGILTLPAISQTFSSSSYMLVVNGSAQNIHIFSDLTQIFVENNNMSVLIQTDKLLYKAGEQVKIRIICVNRFLKPHKGPVDYVIRDPASNIVLQRLSIKSYLGVVSTDFSLSNKPMLGFWNIQATCDGTVTTVQFSVGDYVEPKFDVTLDVPSLYLPTENSNLSGTVTAKYFYGKIFNGSVTLSVVPQYGYEVNAIIKTYQISGSVNFSFLNAEIQKILYWGTLNITASVMEAFTDIVVSESSLVLKVDSAYIIQLVGQPQAFTPGENFTFRILIYRFDNKKLTSEERSKLVSVRITQPSGEYWLSSSSIDNVMVKNYTIPESDVIVLEFPVHQLAEYLHVQVDYQNTAEYFYFYKSFWKPPSIQVQMSETVLKVGIPFTVEVKTFPKVEDIYYVVMAKSMIVSVGKNKTTFSLTPDYSWTPTAQLVVYYLITNGSFGDIVQNVSQVLPVKTTSGNQVTLSWSKKRAEPFENVSLSITVKESPALVALQVLEKSSMLLVNGISINASTVEAELNTYYQSFLASVTDARVYSWNGYYARKSEEVVVPQKDKSILSESWIWLDKNMSSSLTKKLEVTVPNKNTTWVATAFVISEGLGLGVTDLPVELSVDKPLVTILHMPVSLTRGEQYILEVILFNNYNKNLQVSIKLESSNSFDIIVPNNTASTVPGQNNVTVESGAGKTVLFPINPKKLGNATVTVTIMSQVSSEVLTKTILVKAEGVKNFHTHTVFIDLTGNVTRTISSNISFTFPSDVVPDSVEGFVTVVGDILAPSINGLESLIQMPYGCGEQNMINFAPNIYILVYLKATMQIKSDIKERAINYMEKGYQRELTYKRFDGSFSAFGNSDNSGSTWLTAFVFRCFLQARPFMYIDSDVLNQTVEWLVQYQDINTGIFSEPGRVIHTDLQGGLNGPTTLTAYILTSLLEDEFYRQRYEPRVQKAVKYLESKYDEGITSNYTLSVVVYALSLANSSKAAAALNELNSRASTTGSGKYWSTPSQQSNYYWQPRTTDIETAAYALLSYYQQGKIIDGLLVMKWLSQQRNYLGGYTSTQDTVMALQALSKFVSIVNFDEGATSLTLTVTGSGSFVPKSFVIDSTNLLVLQRQQIDVPQPLSIYATAVGRGLAIFQLNLAYNRKTSSRTKRESSVPEAFKLDVTVKENASNLHILTVDVCTSYQGANNNSGMVIADVGFLSGFQLSPAGIPTTDILRLVEPKDDKVFLYLDSVSSAQICVSVPLVRYANVAGSQDAVVTIYEYYNPRNTATRTYNSQTMKAISYCDFCGFNCTQCKSNVPVKPQTNSSTKPTCYLVILCIALIAYLF